MHTRLVTGVDPRPARVFEGSFVCEIMSTLSLKLPSWIESDAFIIHASGIEMTTVWEH
jgi:hypothetical protein